MKMDGIKSIITNTMFVTGMALVILAVFSLLLNVEIHFVPTVFEIFAANILIILGLFLRWKFEIRNIILEYLVDISYIIVVLVIFGLIFDWYSAIPVWLLVAMAVVIYIFAMIISVTRINKDAKELNKLLQKRLKKQADNAS
jgi:peptidoglycan/LPS O-acetylase OafA/YrhL